MTRQASREGHEPAPGLISRITGTSSVLQPYVPGRRPGAHAHMRTLAARSWRAPDRARETSAHDLSVLLERLAATPKLDDALHLIASELPRVLDVGRVVVTLNEPRVAADSQTLERMEPAQETPVTVARTTRPLWLLPRRPAPSGEILEVPIKVGGEHLGVLHTWMVAGDEREPDALLAPLRIACTALGQQVLLCRLRETDPAWRPSSSGALTVGEQKRWSALLGYMAHEVKTPLTCIKGHAQLLSRYVRAARATTTAKRGTLAQLLDDCERHLPALEKQVARIDQLLCDVLDLAQSADGGQALARTPVDLAALVAAAARRLSAAGPGHIRVVNAKPVWVACDAAHIERVVGDLLCYAQHFDPEGEIRIRALEEKSADDASASQARVVIASRHITEERVPSPDSSLAVFGTDSATSLLNLKLALSAAILCQHGGSLQVLPGQAGGGEIILKLPLLQT